MEMCLIKLEICTVTNRSDYNLADKQLKWINSKCKNPQISSLSFE